MELVLPLVRQTLTMFLLVGAGYALFKSGKITTEGSKVLGGILIYASLPCVLISSFLLEPTRERILGLAVSAALGFGLILLCALGGILCFRSDPIARFAATFSNPGFFGIPLILATLGEQCVFYTAAFIAFVNLGQWSYGVGLLTGKTGRIRLKELLKAPFTLAIAIGLFLFFSGLRLPEAVLDCVNTVKAVNTPLAMFSVGVYLAQTNIKRMLTDPKVYRVALVRLLVIPATAVVLLWLLPESLQDMKLAALIAVSCPVGSNIAVYAQLHNADYGYAVETVVISTLCAIVSMPLIVTAAQLLWTI